MILTPREHEAMRMYLIMGTRAAAAQSMSITLHTYNVLLMHAFDKLDVQGMVQACIALGWLRIPPAEVMS